MVKKVIAGQPGSAIPSGGVMNAKSKFWTELTDGLYAAEKTIGKIGDQGLGGSASKAATAEGDHGDDRDSHDSTEEGGCEDEGGGDCAATAESMKRGAHSVQARDGQGKNVKKARRSMESLAARQKATSPSTSASSPTSACCPVILRSLSITQSRRPRTTRPP